MIEWSLREATTVKIMIGEDESLPRNLAQQGWRAQQATEKGGALQVFQNNIIHTLL